MARRGRAGEKREKKAPIVFRSVSQSHRPIRVVRTGIVALDAILGGGIIVGNGVELYGPSRGGKTNLAYEITRAFQQEGGPARGSGDRRGLWTVVGELFDRAVFERVGGDSSMLDYEARLTTVEDYVETALAWIARHRAATVPKVEVLDSLAMLQTRAEVAGGMDSNFDDRAKQIYKGLRMLQGHLSTSGTTFVAINQIRQRRLAPGDFRNPETTPGGWGPEFFGTQRLRLSQGTLKKGKKMLIRKGGAVVGRYLQVQVTKNRLTPVENESVELAWMYETGFDPCAGIFRLLADRGLLKEKTAGSDDGREVWETKNGKGVTDEDAFVEAYPDMIREVYIVFRPESVSGHA